ncbi:MAG: cupin domain-containing protein [Dehalococcoidia bacterium]
MAEPRVRAFGDIKQVPAFPGVTRRTLASGDRLTLVRIDVERDHTVPQHVHPHEQAGTVIIGRISIRIGDTTSICDEGDVYLIPGDIPHEVTALEPSTLIEVFAPVREDFVADLDD